MEFLPFFLVLLIAILFSVVSRRFHLPWVIALIVAGIIAGPHGFALIESTPTIEFLGTIGLVFLMFMAGLEIKFSTFREFKGGIALLALLNGAIPLAVGFGIGHLFGFSTLGALLLGIIFVSTSIAVVIPTLEANGLIHSKLGRMIVAAAIVEDVVSLILLSIVLQTVDPITTLPLPLFYLLLFGALMGLRFLLPRLRDWLSPAVHHQRDIFQQEVRIVLGILLGTVVAFELLGLHPIIAGFFAGLVLSDSIRSEQLVEKLRTIGYGIFIPIFFVLVGMQTDIGIFLRGHAEVLLVLAVLAGSLGAKFASGWVSGKLLRFSNRESSIIGFATMPQLSTTLAVVFTAVALDLIKPELITAMVVLSMVTTFAAPLALRYLRLPSQSGAPVE